jgi:hypothetical protein
MTMALILIGLVVCGVAALLLWPPFDDGRSYLPNAEEARWLRAMESTQDERGRRAFGRATLEKRGGLNVIRLCGSHYEMGFQHGRLLHEEIRDGVVPYYGHPVQHFAPFKHMNALARFLLAKYFDWTIYRPLMKASPAQYLAEIKGVADGSGLAFADIFRGNMLSDFNMNLVKVLEKKFLKQAGQNGCTSFAAFGSATPDGDLIMGRNTDYAGSGLWDRNQTVMFYEPADGYRFANVSSAGLLKCNSCMNEKGVCLGAHFLFLNDTRADGVSFTFLELEIMKRAATVDEAIAIVKQNPRAGAFAFLIADGESNQAAVLEASAGNVGVRRTDDGVIWETNMATTAEIEPVDVLLGNGIGKNPIARFERMRMLSREKSGSITPEVAAQFMGDHMDMCSDSMRPVGGIISQGMNLTSAVFRPATFDFWVADGLSPVCNNPYIGFNLTDGLADRESSVEPHTLAPNDYVATDDYRALRKYYEASVSFMIPPTDEEATFERLEEAIAIKPDEAIYRRLAATMLLQRGDAAAALDHLRRALECVQSPSELAQAHLLLGFANDLLGRRDEAAGCYREVTGLAAASGENILRSVNRFIVADAEKHSRTPFTQADAKKIDISFEITGKYDY